jgi:riboflavin transporter FmnP
MRVRWWVTLAYLCGGGAMASVTLMLVQGYYWLLPLYVGLMGGVSYSAARAVR